MDKTAREKERFLFNYFCNKLAKSMFIYFFISISLLVFVCRRSFITGELDWLNILFLLFFSFGVSEFACRFIAYLIIDTRSSTLSTKNMDKIRSREAIKLKKLKEEKDSLEEVLKERIYEPDINGLRRKLRKIKANICIKESELSLFL